MYQLTLQYHNLLALQQQRQQQLHLQRVRRLPTQIHLHHLHRLRQVVKQIQPLLQQLQLPHNLPQPIIQQ